MKASILVLEDDQNLQELIIDLLEGEGYQMRGASNAEEAVRLARQHTFHLMISDVRMAGARDGLGAVAHIKKELQPRMFVLVMTGYADDEAPYRAMDAEVDGYLYKNDFTAKLLVTAVQGILQQHEQKGFFRSLFEPVLSASRRYLQAQEQARYDAAREKLDEGRLATYRRYVVAIQSRQMLMGGALEIWDMLSQLESYYPKLSKPQEMGALFERYAEVHNQIARKGQNHISSQRPRQPGQVERKPFQGLFDRIVAGTIHATELQMAETLRRMEAAEVDKNPQYKRLHARLWGVPLKGSR